MEDENGYEVIIIGGSYAGLSAAMSLGRSLRDVVVIDENNPCNASAAHSHNFLTQDGQTPGEILRIAREQVAKYSTVSFQHGLVTDMLKDEKGFTATLGSGQTIRSKKIIFATGLKDILSGIAGLAACWGKSVLHCPYCHGYEVMNEATGLIGNGEFGYELTKMISHWAPSLTIFTNGPASFKEEQLRSIREKKIPVIETPIQAIGHADGKVDHILLNDETAVPVTVIYAKPPFVQHCDLPARLGCEMTEQHLVKVDLLQKTTVPGIFACGDNSNFGRAVSLAVAAGAMAGMACNKELIEESFNGA